MINSLSYKLIREPNTVSEQVFTIHNTLNNFIKENESRIFVIQASNSLGKSFILNIIAHAFYALDLNKDELTDSLRRRIKDLINEEHQTLEYNLSLSDPDGYILESSKDSLTNKQIVIKKDNNGNQILINEDFIKEYKLFYDIPEKPLDRIYQLLIAIKAFNKGLLDKLTPLHSKIREISMSIRDERNEDEIKKIENRLELNRVNKKNYLSNLEIVKNKLKNLQNQIDLTKLVKLNNSYEITIKKYNKICLEFNKLSPPSNANQALQDMKKINQLKSNIRIINIENSIIAFKNKIENNDSFLKLSENFTADGTDSLEIVYKFSETILDTLFKNDIREIANIINELHTMKNYFFNNFFEQLKTTKGLNEDDYKYITKLTSDFEKYSESTQYTNLLKNILEKDLKTILEELKQVETKFEEIVEINNVQNSINISIDNIVKKINEAKKISIEITKENQKLINTPSEVKIYNDKKNTKISLHNEKTTQLNDIQSIRNKLEINSVPLIKLNSTDEINDLLENFKIMNLPFKGIEDTKIVSFTTEIKTLANLISQTEKTILEDELKFKIENNKIKSNYSMHSNTINMFNNKLAHFQRWLTKNNTLIKDSGELEITPDDRDNPYLKLTGEFIASLMGKQILYQDNLHDISHVDYTTEYPCFVTTKDVRIFFSDFSGGQGSSNYLRAKLNNTESRKQIVLLDEISMMDNKSLNEVIKSLHELDKNNKLILAILAKPVEEPNIFEIQAY